MKQSFILSHDVARKNAIDAVKTAPDGYVVDIKERTRTLDQNALLWPLLQEIADQVEWYGQHLSKEDWKDVLTASLRKQRAVPAIDGGFVILGSRTSKMSKSEFSDLIELIYAFGAERGVRFKEPRTFGDSKC